MTKKIKILLADDDLKYSVLLKSYLESHGYEVAYAGNGRIALDEFMRMKPDLVLLDINMPILNGFEVAPKIRETDSKVLLFFLTDRTEKTDRLTGFRLQANDYLAKPFYPEELLARIEERFRTQGTDKEEEETYRIGQTTFRYSANELCTRSSKVLVTSRQADILRLLARHLNTVVSKETIQETVWGHVSYANSLAVNVQISHLRRAISHDDTLSIVSLKKKGFMLKVSL